MFKFLKSLFKKEKPVVTEEIIEEPVIDDAIPIEEVEEDVEVEIGETNIYNLFEEKILKGFRVVSFYKDIIGEEEESGVINRGINIGGHGYKPSLIKSPLNGEVIKIGYDVFHGEYVSIYHDDIVINSKKAKLITTYYGIHNRIEDIDKPIRSGDIIGKIDDRRGDCKFHMEVTLDELNVDPLPFIVDSYESEEITHFISRESKNHYVLEIKRLQENLTKLGFYAGSINGKVDDETYFAIRLFQKSNDLEITGELDKKSRDRLKELIK